MRQAVPVYIQSTFYNFILPCASFQPYFIPVTSRKPREDEKDGQAYKFVSRSEMEADIKAGKYLEHGEYEGNLYGTKIGSILDVVQTGRTCILDVNPQVSCMDSTAVVTF